MHRLRWLRAVAFVIVTLAAIPTVAGALLPDLPYEPTYTGCLKPGGGVYRFHEGSDPKQPCEDGEKEIRLSGGDITAVKGGTGLSGAVYSDEGSLAIAPTYRLPQNCPNGKVAKSNGPGASWGCQVDAGGIAASLGPLTADTQAGTDYCQDYDSEFVVGGDPDVETTAAIPLAAGTYRPFTAGTFRWFVNRIGEFGDGETFTGGAVKAEIVKVVNGNEAVVSTWARGIDEHNDGAALPYNQDFTSFSVGDGASVFLRVTATVKPCSRSRLLNAKVELDRIA